MKTEETIEYFENYIKAATLMGFPESKQDKMFRSAIVLLEEGKKCKQMLSEIENFIGIGDINIDEFKKIEQKYFPEPKEEIKKC